MQHSIVVAFLLLFTAVNCNSQAPHQPRRNALSFELGKTGLIYNLGYDHRFKNKNLGFHFDIGSNLAKYLHAFKVGGGAYYLAGKKTDFLELGADLHYLAIDEISDDQKGFSFVYPGYAIKTYYASLNIGYRKYGKKSLFRAGVSPGVIKNGFVPGGYISLGMTF